MLPSMVNVSSLKRSLQTEFGSYKHLDSAETGDIYDMNNLSSDKFPLLTSRKKRKVVKSNINGTVIAFSDTSADCFVYRYYSFLDYPSNWSNGDIIFRDGNNEYLVCESESESSKADRNIYRLGDLMLIMPDKKLYYKGMGLFDVVNGIYNIAKVTFKGHWYNKEECLITVDEFTLIYNDDDLGRFGDLEMSLYAGKRVCFVGSSKTDMDDSWFKVNEISGTTIYPGKWGLNDKPIFKVTDENAIEESDGYVCFEDVPIESDGYISLIWSKNDNEIPDLICACECNNRIWGCSGKTIYASALGSLVIWEKYLGISTDSFTVETGEKSDFVGCVNYRDSVLFFTEDKMFRLYGDKPSNFQILCIANVGLEKDSKKSFATAGEVLFFKSTNGIYAYNGGVPVCISNCFGDKWYSNAVAGSDGIKYYVSMRDISNTYNLFVYDTRYGTWHKENSPEIQCFAEISCILYFSANNQLLCIDNGSVDTVDMVDEYGDIEWMCEFADLYEHSSYNKRSTPIPTKKGIVRFYIRAELSEGASMTAEILYDSEIGNDGKENWQKIGDVNATKKRTCILPIIPRRADHFKLRLSGKGDFIIYSITREYYTGSFI